MIMVYLTKLEGKQQDNKTPWNIPVGSRKHFTTSKEVFQPPQVGKPFYPCSWYSTSIVIEIVDEKTFKTENSIYEWSIEPIIARSTSNDAPKQY